LSGTLYGQSVSIKEEVKSRVSLVLSKELANKLGEPNEFIEIVSAEIIVVPVADSKLT